MNTLRTNKIFQRVLAESTLSVLSAEDKHMQIFRRVEKIQYYWFKVSADNSFEVLVQEAIPLQLLGQHEVTWSHLSKHYQMQRAGCNLYNS